MSLFTRSADVHSYSITQCSISTIPIIFSMADSESAPFEVPISQLPIAAAIRKSRKRALEPIPLDDTPAQMRKKLKTIEHYTPPISMAQRSGALNTALEGPMSEITAFLLLFSVIYVDIIITATNSYAEQDRRRITPSIYIRPWHPINRTEILQYFSCLFYMRIYKMKHLELHWKEDTRISKIFTII